MNQKQQTRQASARYTEEEDLLLLYRSPIRRACVACNLTSVSLYTLCGAIHIENTVLLSE